MLLEYIFTIDDNIVADSTMEQVRDGSGHSRRGCRESIARAAAPLARGPRALRKVSKDENIKGLLRRGAGHLEVSNF